MPSAPVRFSADWPDQLRDSPLPPMLLQQRARRLARTPPSRCTLSAEPLADGGLRLAFDQSGLCGGDAELRGLAKRLRSLFGGPAELQCRSTEDNTLFTLELRTRAL
jgi:hypothetical protein